MSASTLTYGNYVASEYAQFWRPRDYKPGRRVVIWGHGAAATYALGPHEKAFVDNGIAILACDLGGASTWGSDTAVARIQTAWTYAQTRWGVASDKYGLWGGSMGTLTALLAVLADPTHVSVCAGALPVVDPEQVRSENAGGYQAAIQAVHGVGTVPSAKRPNQNVSAYISAAVPLWFARSDTDTVGSPALADAFIAAVGAQSVSLGASGHSYLTMDNTAAFDFLNARLNS